MPLVKRWQPQVEPAPMPSVSPVTQDWSGVAAVQRAALHAADVVSTVAAEEAQKANDARVTQQTAEFDRAANDLLLDPTVDDATGKPKGYKLLNGEDAFSQRDAYAAKVQELQKQYREGLASDTQRELFDKRTTPQVTSYLGEIHGHAGKAAEAAQKTAFKLGQEANLATALNFAGNPELRGAALEGLRRDAEKQAVREGLPPVAAARFADDQAAAANAAVVQRLARDNPAEARNFFDTVNATAKPDGTGGFGVYVAKAEEAIRAGTLKTRANQQSLEILALTSGDSTQALAKAEAIPEVELRDEVVQRVTKHFSEAHAMRVAKDAPLLGRLEQTIYRGGGLSRTSDDYQALSDEGKAIVENKAKAQANTQKALASEERRQQAEEDRRLKALFDSLPTEEQVKLDVSTDKRFSTGSETAILVIKGDQKKVSAVVQKGAGVDMQKFVVEATDTAKGVYSSDKKKAEAFVAHMKSQFVEWKLQPGNENRNPTPAESYEMMKTALTKGERARSEGFLQPNMYAWEAKQKGVAFTSEGFEGDQPGLKVLNERQRSLGGPGAAPATAAPAPAAPAIPPGEAAALQAEYAKRFPGQPALSPAELQKAYEKKKGAK